MRSVEATGKNVKQAVENALLELHASQEDVDIKVLSEGGFLKKAKVLVSISEEAKDKYEKHEKFKEELEKEEKVDGDFAEDFMKQKISSNKTAEKTEKKVAKEAEKEDKKAEKEEIKAEKKVRIIADDEISQPVKKERAAESKKHEETEFKEKKFTAEEFLKGVLKTLNLNGEIEKSEDEKFVRYNLCGEELNDLIGHHGDCMLSLSYIMSMVCKNENNKRLLLDVENYRARREESLVALAKRVADKVARSGRYHKFEPMDASERKIIHTALQDDERVTTLSKGIEPNRYLIVFPKEYQERK